jgi:hypothetical protein
VLGGFVLVDLAAYVLGAGAVALVVVADGGGGWPYYLAHGY